MGPRGCGAVSQTSVQSRESRISAAMIRAAIKEIAALTQRVEEMDHA